MGQIAEYRMIVCVCVLLLSVSGISVTYIKILHGDGCSAMA